ncbi:deoxyribose-phosphate aldolase [Raineyella sp. W15-4]|uniref:deoxyribose-phosphate aldolase n=1 Tax=Raineyella sp. W15-4 TaxID=3081651 RepID=UPI0029558273|nr:deoxyribose-phosphate aldolase [Raineyella sp. W15-4]WOQ17099.1 deoxyribose-phosphate aldolase [Raineyella sp. W15-4]
MITRQELAQLMDHTLLRPEATAQEVAALAQEARELGTYAICVSPARLPVRVDGVRVATVCGFPSGAVAPSIKAAEAALAAANGAAEVDMVVDLGAVKGAEWAVVANEIAAVRAAVPAATVLKVIIESAILTDDEIVRVCRIAEQEGADFVKTSTGFHPAGGASVHAVRLMAETVGPRLGVKASGGIRDLATALAMVEAGATRLGLSSSRKILTEFDEPVGHSR